MSVLHDLLVFIGVRKRPAVSGRLAAMEANGQGSLPEALRKARQANAKALRSRDEARRQRERATRSGGDRTYGDETSPSVHMRWSDEGHSASRAEVDIALQEVSSYRSGGGGDFGGGGASGSWESKSSQSDDSNSTSSSSSSDSSSDSSSSSSSSD